jgi:hypothetical protein
MAAGSTTILSRSSKLHAVLDATMDKHNMPSVVRIKVSFIRARVFLGASRPKSSRIAP